MFEKFELFNNKFDSSSRKTTPLALGLDELENRDYETVRSVLMARINVVKNWLTITFVLVKMESLIFIIDN